MKQSNPLNHLFKLWLGFWIAKFIWGLLLVVIVLAALVANQSLLR